MTEHGADQQSRSLDEQLALIMSSVDVAMTIVTAHAFGESSGCLVGFQGQVSIDPLLWGVWISSANHSYPIVTAADTVAVHFLAADQHDLARHFGSLTGDETDKFAGIELDDARASDAGTTVGAPLLAACPTRIVGRRVDVLYGPTDHSCVVIEPHSVTCSARFAPFRITAAHDIDPGHPVRSD